MEVYGIQQEEYIDMVYNELVDIVGDCRDDVEYEKIASVITLAMKTIYRIGWNNAVKRMNEITEKEKYK